jgi:hypothetical protein
MLVLAISLAALRPALAHPVTLAGDSFLLVATHDATNTVDLPLFSRLLLGR